ncbi:MAG: hypothetical protein GC154_09595 [bacterium]|nr:hypothetical protein [bacterium]
MRYLHFCDCGPLDHCGQPVVHYVCSHCGAEYIGADCDVTRPLPVFMNDSGEQVCRACSQKLVKIHQHASSF